GCGAAAILCAQSSVTRSESWMVRTVSISSSALSAPQLPTISRTSVATPPRSTTAYRAAWTTVGRSGWVYPYSLAIQVVPSSSLSPVLSSSSSRSAALRWSRPARADSSVNSGPKRCTVTTTFARKAPSTRGFPLERRGHGAEDGRATSELQSRFDLVCRLLPYENNSLST